MMKIWSCKIGEVSEELLPHGADFPMREAVEKAYEEITGQPAAFVFSGWGGSLTEGERACVENRLPDFDLVASEDPETLLAEVTALRAKLDADALTKASLEGVVADLQADCIRLRSELVEAREDFVRTNTALRAEVDAARAGLEESQREWHDAQKEIEELSRDLSAHAERVDPDKDVWQYLDGTEVRAERTEPATGEDVEQARAEVAHILTTWWESDGYESPEQLADRLLAALDLPRREQALREEISAEELARATDAAEYGYQAEFNRLTAERDAALQRLANVNQEASAS